MLKKDPNQRPSVQNLISKFQILKDNLYNKEICETIYLFVNDNSKNNDFIKLELIKICC